MSNSQILDHLRYCAEAFTFHESKVKAEANLRQFAAGLIGSQCPPSQSEYLAYCAEQGIDSDSKIARLFFDQGCRAAAPISPPAPKPASVPGGSGAGLVGIPQKPVIFIKFLCRDFGTNSLVCCLHDWPGLRRSIGRKNLLEVRLSGSLV